MMGGLSMRIHGHIRPHFWLVSDYNSAGFDYHYIQEKHRPRQTMTNLYKCGSYLDMVGDGWSGNEFYAEIDFFLF